MLACFLFCAMLSLGWIGLYMGPDAALIYRTETRVPYPVPYLVSFKGIDLKKYFKMLESYGEERMVGRNFIMRNYVNFLYHFDTPAFPERVILGRENFLFLGNAFARVVDKFLGLVPFSDIELQGKIQHLRKMVAMSEENKKTFLFFVAPNKHSVYSRYMPSWAQSSRPSLRPENQLAEAAEKSALPILNLTSALISAAQTNPDQLLFLNGIPIGMLREHFEVLRLYITNLKNLIQALLNCLAPLKLSCKSKMRLVI